MTIRRPASNRLLLQHIRALCGRPQLSLPATVLLSMGTLTTVLAEPTGGIVVSGQGNISTPTPGRTVIEQGSQNLQLNWNTFNLAANESVQFQQPSSSAVALNRILDQNPSQIFGHIDANGKVILVNPNGLLFGQSAQLNVGSLVASSLDIVGFDAASGRYTFGSSGNAGAVINEGYITAGPGGSVTLLGSRVTNTGNIVANFGSVNLAAGRAATLDLAGDGLLRLEVDEQLVEGGPAAVENSGSIQADGGQVLLSAKALDGVLANLVNNTGLVRANRIESSGGTIRLVGTGGTVRSSGTLDASAGDAVSTGGEVEVLGEQVGLFGNALVDVSGATGGGTALIGGDYQGKNPEIPNATRTYVGADVVIDADAGTTGDGGKVIVWADEFTRFGGHISARGGTQSGDGGFAEVSGKESLAFTGTANLGAAHGDGGTLLLDPRSITIAAGSGTDTDIDDGAYSFAEDAATDAIIGDQTIESLLSGGFDVLLQGTNAIVQQADADINVAATPGAAGHSLTMESATLVLNGDILLNGGDLNLTSSTYVELRGGIDTNGGNVAIVADNNQLTMYDGSSIFAGDGSIVLDAGGDIRLTQLTTLDTVTVTSGGFISDDDNNSTFVAGATGVSLDAVFGIGSITNPGAVNDSAIGPSVDVQTNGALHARASSNVGRINLNLSGTPTLAAGSISVGTGSSRNGIIALQSSNGLDLSGAAVGAINIGTSSSTTVLLRTPGLLQVRPDILDNPASFLQLRGGIDIVDADASSRSWNITAHDLDFRSGGLGGATTLNTSVEYLSATHGNNRNLTVNEADSIVVQTIDVSGATFNLTAGQDILDDSNDPNDNTRIVADTATLIGSSIGEVFGRAVDTRVGTLDVTATSGGISIVESDALTLNAYSNSNVTLRTLNGSITVNTSDGVNFNLYAAGGGSDITLNGLLQATGTVDLTAGSAGARGDIVSGFGQEMNADVLVAVGANIGSSVAPLTTDVNRVRLVADNGNVYLTDANFVSLWLAQALQGSVNVTSLSNDILVEDLRANSAVLTATNGRIYDNIFAGSAINVGTLTLDARNVGFAGAALDMNVNSLVATVGQRADIHEQDSLTLTSIIGGSDSFNLQSGGNIIAQTVTGFGGFNLQSAGNITVQSLTSAGSITLTASGSILDDNDDNTVIQASELSLTAANSIGTVNAFGAENNADIGNQLDLLMSGTLSAVTTSDVGQINLNFVGGTPTLGAGAIRVGNSAAGRAGEIVLHAATGNLDLSGVAAGAIDVGANSSTRVSLRSDSILTLPSHSITNQDAGLLLVHGGTDVVDSDGSPRALSLNASHLIFRSGAIGGATTLNTSVGRLDATSNQSLTVSETNDVTLGSISVGSGFILAAGGAVADDGDDNTRISAAGVTLSGTSLGASDNAIDTNAVSLDLTASNGGAYVIESDAINLSASAGGPVNVQTLSGSITAPDVSGDGVTLVAGGDNSFITLGTLDARTGNVSLTAGTPEDRGNLFSTTGLISADAVIIVADAVVLLDTAVNSLDVTGGSLTVLEADDLALTAHISGATGSVVAQTGSGLLTVNDLTGNSATLTSGGSMQIAGSITVSGNATLTSSGSMHIAGSIAAAGDADLRVAAVGEITDGTTGAASVSANLLRMTGGSFGSADNPIETRVAELVARSTAAGGGVYVAEQDGLQLVNVMAIGTGSHVGVRSETGDIDVFRVAAHNSVTLAATAGGINDDNVDTTVISTTTGAVSLSAATHIGTATVTDAEGSAAVVTGSSVDVQSAGYFSAAVTSNSGDIHLNLAGTPAFATGAISLGSGDGGAGDIVLRSTGNLNLSGLTSDSILVGANNTTNVVLQAGGTLTLPTSVQFIDQAVNLLSINAATLADSNGGAVDLTLLANQLDFHAGTSVGASLVTSVARLDAGLTSGTLSIAELDDITLGTISTNDAISLFAGGAIRDDGDDTTLLSTTGAVTLVGSSVGDSGNAIDLAAASLSTTALSGSIHVDGYSSLQLAATAADAVNVQLLLPSQNLVVSGPVNAATTVSLTTSDFGNIVLNDAVRGSGQVTLTAGTSSARGTISGAGQVDGDSLVATAGSMGSNLSWLNTSVNSLTATATSGDIYVHDHDGAGLNFSATALNGDVNVATDAGPMIVDRVSGQTVNLIATDGAITDTNASPVQADTLLLWGASVGDGSNMFETNVGFLVADTTAGDVYIREQDDLFVSGQATGLMYVQSDGNITAAYLDGAGVTLQTGSNGGYIDVMGPINGDTIRLNAAAGINSGAIIASPGNLIQGGTLIAAASHIGAVDARLNTDVDTLTLMAPADIFVTEQNAATLNAFAFGIVDVAAVGTLTVASVTAGEAQLFGGALDISGSITADTVDLFSNSTLTDGTGTSIVAGQLSLGSLGTIGSGSNALNVQVSSLGVAASEAHIVEQDGVTLDFAETVDGLSLTSLSGDITVGTVLAGGTASLTSLAGSILDDGDTDTYIDAGNISLEAANNIGSVDNIDAGTGADIGSEITVRTGGILSARSDSNNGQINLQIIDLAPTVAAGGISVGNGAAAGRIALHAEEDLDLSGLGSGAISAGGSELSTVVLRAGNVLTLPSYGTFTDAALGHLYIRGADVVASGAASHSLALQASHIDFRSGATADTTLTTNVNLLDVTIDAGLNLTVNETDSLALGSINAAGSNVNITAGDAIADDENSSTRLVADSATLSGTTIGSTGAEIGTQVTTLTANASAGTVDINNTDALTLVAASGQRVNVRTLDGALTVGNVNSSGAVNLSSGGAGNGITLDGVVSGGGLTTLTAGTDANRGAIQTTVNGRIQGLGLTATGSTLGTSSERLNTNVNTLDLTATTGDIFVTEQTDVSLRATATNGIVDVRTDLGSLQLGPVTGTGLVFQAGVGSSLVVNGPVTAGTGNIVLTATDGFIFSTPGNSISGGSLTATAGTISLLNIAVDAVNATATIGGLDIIDADALNLTATANGRIFVNTSNGALTVNSVTGDGVILVASGTGTDLVLNGTVNAGSNDAALVALGNIVAGAGHHVTARDLQINGVSIGSATARLNTTVDSLYASAGLGGVFVSDSDALYVADARSAGGAVDIQTLDGSLRVDEVFGYGVNLSAAGDGSNIIIDDVLFSTEDVTLTAGTADARGAITGTSDNSVQSQSLTAIAAAIGTNDQRLNTQVATLNATATNGGIFVSEADSLRVNAIAQGGVLDVRTTNGAIEQLVTQGDGVTLVAGGAGNGIALSSDIDVGSGNVRLTAGGAITAAPGLRVSGNTLTASGASVGTSAQRLNTSVTSLNATSTGGGIFITEADALTLSATATGGTVDVQTLNGALALASISGNGVTLLAGGDGNGITMNGHVNGGTGDVTLTAGTTANRGAIVAGSGSHITGATVTATGSSIGSSTARLNTAAGTLNVTSTNGGIFVTESDVLSLIANAAGGAVDVQTTNGALTVTSASGNGMALVAGGAGNGITINGIVDAGAGNVILTAGTPASGGAITGNAGHRIIGNSLTTSGSRIGADANTRLQTNIAALIATASNGGVFVAEQNDLTLANVSASGEIVATTAGNLVAGNVNATGNVLLSGTTIVDDGSDATRVTGDSVALEADAVGTAARRLGTNATSLNANAGTGDIFIEELNGLQSLNLNASSGSIELVNLGGDLNVGSVNAGETILLSAGGNILAALNSAGIVADRAELRAGTADASLGRIGSFARPLQVELSEGTSLRLFTPSGVSPTDLNRAPAISPSAGVTMTLSTFAAPNTQATLAGFGQFQGLNETPFTSPQPRNDFSSQTGPILPLIGPNWIPLDPNVSLFSTSATPVCLPADQRREKNGNGGC